MTEVIALTSFDHGGNRRRNSKFEVSDLVAKELAQQGLVRIVKDNPTKPAGKKSSASPAGQASRQKTAKKSGAGDKEEPTGA
ncbi:hypothetical protein G8770_03590 [Aestuariicella hydrocarbonica]|uniref:Uncharacterized protein n=1 Tax=Pseudomaricurvus hydrocarbonicus TaxID=1470433 RepID=A0A9E5MLI8_9GAMM|nr:hypothetical protein [Aestuariicella hydrocarbonica]NHO64628.1 hypothetical protein [Aestuariicella hydrocarbonica]